MKIIHTVSVAIANKVYDILEKKECHKKISPDCWEKTETEVSRWLSGTHNMTLATISKISCALNQDIIKVIH